MAAAQGFTEVFNYSFLSEETARRLAFDPAGHARVANPIASDQTLMRTSLLPGVWKNLAENGKHLHTFRLFEIGREIHPRAEGLPNEVPHLMAAVFMREGDGSAGLFELKHLAECLDARCEVQPASAREYEHPERSGLVISGGENLGRLYELHPRLGLEGRAAVLDIDLAALQATQRREFRIAPLRRFPESAFDLSVIAGLREPVGSIEKRIVQSGGPYLIAIEFVRQYTGAPLPEGRKSVSYRLTVGAPDRTLAAEEVSAIRAGVIEVLQEAGYELRI